MLEKYQPRPPSSPISLTLPLRVDVAVLVFIVSCFFFASSRLFFCNCVSYCFRGWAETRTGIGYGEAGMALSLCSVSNLYNFPKIPTVSILPFLFRVILLPYFPVALAKYWWSWPRHIHDFVSLSSLFRERLDENKGSAF